MLAVKETLSFPDGQVADAIVVSLGPKPGPGMDAAQMSICSRSTPILLDAIASYPGMKENLKALVVVTSMGVGDSWDFISDRAKVALKPFLDDKEIQEAKIKESGLKWVILRPSGLRDGERTGGKYEVGEKIASVLVNRADVAEVILDIVEGKKTEWFHKTPSVVGMAV
jgi:hypothetical protein